MSKIKLLNKGERSIFHDEGVIAAGKVAAVSPSIASLLRRLYPDEIHSIDDMFKEFEEQAAVVENAGEKALSELPLKELKAKAKELDISVPHGTTAEDIIALIEAK